jgi:hypothetical protein
LFFYFLPVFLKRYRKFIFLKIISSQKISREQGRKVGTNFFQSASLSKCKQSNLWERKNKKLGADNLVCYSARGDRKFH